MSEVIELGRTATKVVEIEGAEYEVRIGQLGVLPLVRRCLEAVRGLEEAQDPDEAMRGLGEFVGLARQVVAMAMGEGAAEDLLGGDLAWDMARTVSLLSAIVRMVGSEEARRAVVEGIAEAARTLDEG